MTSIVPPIRSTMLFVIAMLFLSTVGTVFYIYKKNIISEFSEVKKS